MSKPVKQIDKFKEAARELEANNDPAAFDRKMKQLKLKKPQPAPSKPSTRRGSD